MMSETGVTGVELFVKNRTCLNSVIDTFGSLISTMSMTSNPTFTSSFKSEDGSLGTNTFLYVFSSLMMKLQVFSSLPSVQSSRSSHFLSRGIQPPFQHVNWSLGQDRILYHSSKLFSYRKIFAWCLTLVKVI